MVLVSHFKNKYHSFRSYFLQFILYNFVFQRDKYLKVLGKIKNRKKAKKKTQEFFFLTANRFTKSINLFYIKRRASANWQLSQQGVILRPRDVVVVKDEEGNLRKRQKAKRKIKKKKWTEKWVQFREKKKKGKAVFGLSFAFHAAFNVFALLVFPWVPHLTRKSKQSPLCYLVPILSNRIMFINKI